MIDHACVKLQFFNHHNRVYEQSNLKGLVIRLERERERERDRQTDRDRDQEGAETETERQRQRQRETETESRFMPMLKLKMPVEGKFCLVFRVNAGGGAIKSVIHHNIRMDLQLLVI